jgi:hypothetical protein
VPLVFVAVKLDYLSLTEDGNKVLRRISSSKSGKVVKIPI